MKSIKLSNHKETFLVPEQNLPPLGSLEQLFGYVRNKFNEGWIFVKININENEYLLFDRAYPTKIMGRINASKEQGKIKNTVNELEEE